MGLLGEELADQLLHLGDAGRTAHQHHLVDILRIELGVFERLHNRPAAAFHQGVAHLLELRPGDRHLQVLGACGIGRNERQVDVGALGGTELLLRLFAGLLQTLQGHGVFSQVDPLLFLELIRDVIDERLIEIVAAEMGVAVGGDHPEHTVSHLQHRHIERAATEIKHHDLFLRLLVEAIGQRRGSRLIDDAHHFQARNLTGILRGLPLGIVEVGRNRDHSLVDLVTEVAFGCLFKSTEDLGGDLRRGAGLVARLHLDVVFGTADHLVGNDLLLASHLVVAASHEPLDRIDRPLGVGDGLPPGGVAHERLPLIVKGHHARREAIALLVRDHLGLLALHDRHHRIGGTEIDADDLFALVRRHGF